MVKRLVFMGSPDFAVPALEALAGAGYDIKAVYTQPDRPAGRGRRLKTVPVRRAALALGLNVETPETLRGEEAAAALALQHPDVVIVAAYAKLLPQSILSIPEYGCLNLHPSLLPRHRGASPIPAAILAGDAVTGVSLMQMERGLDTGPVLARMPLNIDDKDTTGSLTLKLARVAAALLIETLPRWFRGEVSSCPQRAEEATYAAVITRTTGKVNWNLAAAEIARAVRAYNPWPAAYTRWSGREFKIMAAVPLEGPGNYRPGTVVALGVGDTPVGVITGRGILGLREVQLEGKKRVSAAAFLRGARDFIGAVLGEETD